MIPLSKETANPFAPVNNEVAVKKDTAHQQTRRKMINHKPAKADRQRM